MTKKMIQIMLSVSLAGVLLLLTVASLLAGSSILTRLTTGTSDRDSFVPQINSDGTRIVFESDADFLGQGIPDGQFEVWLYDAATKTLTRVTVSASGRDSRDPNINSDGTKIVFESDADFLGQGIPNGQKEIWLYNTALKGLTRLTHGASDRVSDDPSISDDGTKIVFESDADFLGQGITATQSEIWLYDTGTMTLTRITTGASDRDSQDPSISGDGTKIVFESDVDFLGQGITATQFEIWLYDTGTMTLTRVTTGTSDRDSRDPQINSDGSKIVFESDADLLGQGIPANQDEVWLYDTATKNLTRITIGASGRDSRSVSLNSDGTKIAFESDVDFKGQGVPASQFEIWVYHTITSTFTRLTPGDDKRDSRSPSISDDGSKIAFESDADFLGQGIPEFQFEIWLYGPGTTIHLPVVVKN